MARDTLATRAVSVDTLYFLGIALIVFTIYQLLFIFTGVTARDQCLYTFWLPYKGQFFSPFWLVAGIVILLLLRTVANFLILAPKAAVISRTEVVLHALAIVCFGIWLYSMYEFSVAMDYERGLISPREFFDKRILDFYVPEEGLHVCKGAI